MADTKILIENSEEKSGDKKEENLLFRSRDDYMFAGIIGGLARYWNINSTILRLIFLLSIILTSGISIIIYFILIKVIPLEPEI